MQAIILAGGRGTRLQSVCPDLPKAMVPVGSRPFLAILLRHLESRGVESVLLSVGYRHEAIMQAFGERFGSIAISYVIEPSPLGTGGALRKALAAATADVVLALNGDTFLDADMSTLIAAHRASGASLTLALARVDDVSRYGSVTLQAGRVVRFNEKGASGPGLINSGVYVLNTGIFAGQRLPEAFSFERDFLHPLLDTLRPAGQIVGGYFIDIGVPEDYRRACVELAQWTGCAGAVPAHLKEVSGNDQRD